MDIDVPCPKPTLQRQTFRHSDQAETMPKIVSREEPFVLGRTVQFVVVPELGSSVCCAHSALLFGAGLIT